jgi:hypothetical protein
MSPEEVHLPLDDRGVIDVVRMVDGNQLPACQLDGGIGIVVDPAGGRLTVAANPLSGA